MNRWSLDLKVCFVTEPGLYQLDHPFLSEDDIGLNPKEKRTPPLRTLEKSGISPSQNCPM